MIKHKFSGSLLAILTLAACQSTQINTASQIALPEQFTHTSHSQASLAQWWQNWHDPVLNQLIEQSLHGSHDIHIAQSRLNEAQAQARLAKADLGANVALNTNTAYGRGGVDNPLNALPQVNDTVNVKGGSVSGGLMASWEPDFFGAKRSDADAAQAATLGAAEQLNGARLLTTATLAEHYLQARALQAQQNHAQATLQALRDMVRYTQGRFRAGHATQYDVNEAQAALSAMQAKVSTLPLQYDMHVRAIAVLLGEVPQNFRLPESPVDVLAKPADVPAGVLPSELLLRRPDLRGKAAAVQAHAAQLASAKADLYPRFAIHFLGQGLRIGLTGENALNAWGGLIGAEIKVPLFTNGRIQANIAAADARLQTALLEYDRTLLQALSDVDNAYQAAKTVEQQKNLLQQAHRQYGKMAQDANKLYRYGNQTLDKAIRAKLGELESAQNLTQAQLAHAQSVLAVYKALGGGW